MNILVSWVGAFYWIKNMQHNQYTRIVYELVLLMISLKE